MHACPIHSGRPKLHRPILLLISVVFCTFCPTMLSSHTHQENSTKFYINHLKILVTISSILPNSFFLDFFFWDVQSTSHSILIWYHICLTLYQTHQWFWVPCMPLFLTVQIYFVSMDDMILIISGVTFSHVYYFIHMQYTLL